MYEKEKEELMEGLGGDFHEFLNLRSVVEDKSSIRFEYDVFSPDSPCPNMGNILQ